MPNLCRPFVSAASESLARRSAWLETTLAGTAGTWPDMNRSDP